jgi:glycerol-3-phosphate cytidylyltransferase
VTVVGYVPGAYDLFHVGHLRILERSRRRCDHLVVGVVGDELAASVRGQRPAVGFEERVRLVAALPWVDEVVEDVSSDKAVAWQRVRFQVVFKGDDWQGTPKGDALEAAMASVGAKVMYLPYTREVSSTMLRSGLGLSGSSTIAAGR